jgi:hypothetical protein
MSNMGTKQDAGHPPTPGQAPVGHLAKKIWERHFPFQELEVEAIEKKLRVLAGDHHELPAAAKEPITPLRRQSGFAVEGAVSLQRELLFRKRV